MEKRYGRLQYLVEFEDEPEAKWSRSFGEAKGTCRWGLFGWRSKPLVGPRDMLVIANCANG